MVKRRRGKPQAAALTGAAAEMGTLLLLIALLALAVQKGAAGAAAIKTGLIMACLAAGTAGVIWGPRGEGSGRLRFLACGVPALPVLILGLLTGGGEGDRLRVALHALCMLLPCLISLAAGERRRHGSSVGRTLRRAGAQRR